MNIILLPMLLAVALSAGAAEPPHATIKPATPHAYIEALGIAHAFLDAWVSRDAEAGIRLMTASLRGGPPGSDPKDYESWLRQYVQGLSNPHHAGFELARGKLSGPKRAVFPVTLYEAATGEPAFRYASELEVVREGNEWRVSKLPKSSDNDEQ